MIAAAVPARLGADTAALASLAVNRPRLTPALARQQDAGSVPLRAIITPRRSIAIDVCLAALVLAIFAWRGTIMPSAAL